MCLVIEGVKEQLGKQQSTVEGVVEGGFVSFVFILKVGKGDNAIFIF